MCECCYCDNYAIGCEICQIYGYPNMGISYCRDFVGRKRGRNFYRQGTLERSSCEIKDSVEKIRLTFWIEDNIYAFCELKIKDTDNIIPMVGKKYLIEFQPRAGRNGSTINTINKVFIPLEVEHDIRL